MRRITKAAVAVVCILALYFGLNYSQWLPDRNTTASTVPSKVIPVSFGSGHHKIASIVYLDATGLPANTIPSLKEMHASEVYLYVAYHSDAYYQIPQNPYGLVEPADTLRAACDELHKNNFKVIAVISSALINTKDQTASVISQPNSSIINPKLALPFVKELVSSLVKYPIDGIYVGEPYWNGNHQTDATTPEQKQDWYVFYQTLVKETATHYVPMYLVLPDLYANGITVVNISGVPEETAKLRFKGVGIDLEDAYQGYVQDDLTRFKNAALKAQGLNHHAESIVEVSLRQGDLKTPVPPAFINQEFQYAASAHVNTVLIFANEWWADAPYRAEYQKSIEQFLRAD